MLKKGRITVSKVNNIKEYMEEYKLKLSKMTTEEFKQEWYKVCLQLKKYNHLDKIGFVPREIDVPNNKSEEVKLDE